MVKVSRKWLKQRVAALAAEVRLLEARNDRAARAARKWKGRAQARGRRLREERNRYSSDVATWGEAMKKAQRAQEEEIARLTESLDTCRLSRDDFKQKWEVLTEAVVASG